MSRRPKAGRGWTDEEFRAVCENVAGVSLQELFEYASTTKAIDYDKYLGYAGLRLEEPVELPGCFSPAAHGEQPQSAAGAGG